VQHSIRCQRLTCQAFFAWEKGDTAKTDYLLAQLAGLGVTMRFDGPIKEIELAVREKTKAGWRNRPVMPQPSTPTETPL